MLIESLTLITTHSLPGIFFLSFLFFLSLHRNKMYNISMATLEENVLEVNEEFHYYFKKEEFNSLAVDDVTH